MMYVAPVGSKSGENDNHREGARKDSLALFEARVGLAVHAFLAGGKLRKACDDRHDGLRRQPWGREARQCLA